MIIPCKTVENPLETHRWPATKNRLRPQWLPFLLMGSAFFSWPGAQAQTTPPGTCIVVVGDSTVSAYAPTEPTRGWGQFLSGYFLPSVTVIDAAKAGYSTRSFLEQHFWERAMENHPHYVLIQFGHNDQKPKSDPRATDPQTTYKENLRSMIKSCRESGAAAILVTPMHRRTFKSDGSLTQELLPYATAMKEVGAEQKVPVVDLYAMSGELFARSTPEQLVEWANKKEDRTHFSEQGAKEMLGLIMSKLPEVEPSLKPLLKNPQGQAAGQVPAETGEAPQDGTATAGR